MRRRFPFVKGHGTENDFVLLPDPDGTLHPDLAVETVRRLTDRHAGLGADGVIRVVRSAAVDDGRDLAADAEWFMDYRNADGSVAEMCGNGVRVLARYLWTAGLADGPVLRIGTRGGVRTVRAESEGMYTVDMGRPEPVPTVEPVRVTVRWEFPVDDAGGAAFDATAVRAPNPHAVVFVDDFHDVRPLREAPSVQPGDIFPDGVNVEYVVNSGRRHIALRVWERGVGETRSCGTGVCAAVWATMRRDGAEPCSTYTIDIPGGRLVVTERADGVLLLTGPAVLGVSGEFELDQV
ncbi:MAG TPA: diaminopimelate epimerase [Jiangellaceae bacterium]|nr:diaminopimelate epimerase [Jiangellaceae bacterium]